MKKIVCSISFWVSVLPNFIFSQYSFVDTTFGDGGIAMPLQSSLSSYSYSGCLDSQGRIVAAGYVGNSGYNMGMIRLLNDGSLDSSFTGDGNAWIDFDGAHDEAKKIIIQPDGKFLLGGDSMSTLSNSSGIAFARLDSAGIPDSTFGGDGKVSFGLGWSQTYFNSACLLQDNKILFSGWYNNGGPNGYDGFIGKLMQDGSPDTSFADQGILYITYSAGGLASPVDLVALPGGKFLGAANAVYFPVSKFKILQFNANGTLDSTFGVNGASIIDIYGYNNSIEALAIEPSGKILAAGSSLHNGVDFLFAATRVNTDGRIDSTFGNAGITRIQVTGTSNILRDMALDSLGRIVLVGECKEGIDTYFGFARLLPNGAPDYSFGTNGIFKENFGIMEPRAAEILVQPDQKIVAVGNAGLWDMAISRLIPDLNLGTLDPLAPFRETWVYPNPIEAGSQLSFEVVSPMNLSVCLVDLSGKPLMFYRKDVFHKPGKYQIPLDFPASLAEGNYRIIVWGGGAAIGLQVNFNGQ